MDSRNCRPNFCVLGLAALVAWAMPARAELLYVSLSDSTIVTYNVSLSGSTEVRNSRTTFASGSPLNAPEEMVFDATMPPTHRRHSSPGPMSTRPIYRRYCCPLASARLQQRSQHVRSVAVTGQLNGPARRPIAQETPQPQPVLA